MLPIDRIYTFQEDVYVRYFFYKFYPQLCRKTVQLFASKSNFYHVLPSCSTATRKFDLVTMVLLPVK